VDATPDGDGGVPFGVAPDGNVAASVTGESK